jgi:hypothetical protein
LRGRAVDANDTLYWSTGLDGAGRWVGGESGGVLLLHNDLLAAVVVLGCGVGVLVRVVVVVAVRVDGVGDTFTDLVGSLGNTVTKRVVVTVVVVISHITLELLGGVGSGSSRFFYANRGWVAAVDTFTLTLVGVGVLGSDSLPCVTGGLLVVGGGAEVGVTLLSDDGTGALAILTLRDVDLGGRVVGGRAVDCVEVTVVGSVLNLDVGVGVRGGWGLVAVARGLDLYTFVLTLLRLPVAGLLVDMDFLAVLLRTRETLLLGDVDLLLDVGVAVGGLVDGGGEGFVGFFVTFPSV